MRYYIALIILFIGCSESEIKPVPDPISFSPAPSYPEYLPEYIDVVTENMEQNAQGLVEVKDALRENTATLLELKEVISTKPTSGGVEPPEPPSAPEMSPPPEPIRPKPPIWETDQYYVQYWGADWCAPCHRFKPRVIRMLPEFGLTVSGDFDWDKDGPNSRAISQVEQVPTVLVCKRGHIIARHVGEIPDGQLREWFRKVLK